MNKKVVNQLRSSLDEGGFFNPAKIYFEIHFLYVMKDIYKNNYLHKSLAGIAVVQDGVILKTFKNNPEVSKHERFQREALMVRVTDWSEGFIRAHRDDYFDVSLTKMNDLIVADENCFLANVKKEYAKVLQKPETNNFN